MERYVWPPALRLLCMCECVCLSNSVCLVLFSRALLCELHGVGASYLFLLQRDGHGVSSSREGALSLSLSPFLLLLFYCPSILLILACFVPGDGLPRGPCVQGGPGWLPARPRETVDHISEGAAQLLRPGRFTLLLQPLARHKQHHPHAGTRRHPGSLLHATKQVR